MGPPLDGMDDEQGSEKALLHVLTPFGARGEKLSPKPCAAADAAAVFPLFNTDVTACY